MVHLLLVRLMSPSMSAVVMSSILVELCVAVPGGAVRVEVWRQGQEAQLGKQLEREKVWGLGRLGFHSSVSTDMLFDFET